jgi:hypothetical protein
MFVQIYFSPTHWYAVAAFAVAAFAVAVVLSPAAADENTTTALGNLRNGK